MPERMSQRTSQMSAGPGSSLVTPTMLAPPRLPARTATVRRQFDQRALRFGQHDALPREVERRLLERLAVIRIEPQRIVDVGCGSAASRRAYAERFPRASWLGVDLSEAMLAQRARVGWMARAIGRERSTVVCAEATCLPLADGSADLLHSNLMLHWHPAPHTVFPEWLRVLRVGGLVAFSCFGPDTLIELRAAFAAVFDDLRPMPFVDMHDFGDMLVASGFENPVMDAERLTLTFASAQSLLIEVRALGGNPRDDRRDVLPSSRQVQRLLAALEAQCSRDGRLSLSVEIAYGHAWKPARRQPNVTSIGLDAVRAELQRHSK